MVDRGVKSSYQTNAKCSACKTMVNNFIFMFCCIYSESKNSPPLKVFSQPVGIFSPNFTHLIYVPIYAGLQFFIQLPTTLMKLCHIKHDHHNVLKMSTMM